MGKDAQPLTWGVGIKPAVGDLEWASQRAERCLEHFLNECTFVQLEILMWHKTLWEGSRHPQFRFF